MPDADKPVWDPQLCNNAAAVDQCLKLGGVIIAPPKKPTGFGGPRDA